MTDKKSELVLAHADKATSGNTRAFMCSEQQVLTCAALIKKQSQLIAAVGRADDEKNYYKSEWLIGR